MTGNQTMFVAMPMNELLDLIEERILRSLKKYDKKRVPKPEDDLLSIQETCTLLRVSKVTIHKWKKNNLIVSYRIGRRVYFKKHELIKAMH